MVRRSYILMRGWWWWWGAQWVR